MEYLARALSIRVIVLSFIVGVAVGVLVGMAWAPAEMPTVWIVAAACYVMAVLTPGQMLRCDACGKRVKMGYSRCHHCGYQRAAKCYVTNPCAGAGEALRDGSEALGEPVRNHTLLR